MYNKLHIRLLGLMLTVLFITATFTAAGPEKTQGIPCPCNCGCRCELPPGRLFALSKERLLSVVIIHNGRRAILEGEDAERAVDLLNSFVVVSVEEGEGYISGSGAAVNLYDSRRDFQPVQSENAIYVGGKKYTLEPWCLEEFYKLYEQEKEAGRLVV